MLLSALLLAQDPPGGIAEAQHSVQLRWGIKFNKEWEDPAIPNVQQVLLMAKILKPRKCA